MQEDFYRVEGLSAWNENRVPSYLTNRMNFVETYVELFLAFIADSHAQLDFEEPLYIVDLGGGTGCFAYRFLNELLDVKFDFPNLRRLNLKYVITDFAQANIDSHLRNPQFKRFVDEGVLDFALFRPDIDRSLHLLKADLTLNSEKIKNPLFAIANHFFSSIKQDAFRALNGALQECQFSLYRDPTTSSMQHAVRLSELQTIERFVDIDLPHYKEPVFDQILEHYRNHFGEASIFFPIAALRAISNLDHLSNHRLVLLASDKGFTSLESPLIKGLRPLEITRQDDSISLNVNFDVIARYFAGISGQSLVETGDHVNLSTIIGTTIKYDLHHLQHYFKQTFQRRDFINSSYDLEAPLFHAELDGKSLNGTKLTLFLALVKNYNYDPHLFAWAFERSYQAIETETTQIDDDHKRQVVEVLRRTFRNLFASWSSPVELDAILRCYVALKEFKECLSVSLTSLELLGRTRTALDHAALSCEQLNRCDEAYEYFRKSFEMSPDHFWAQEGMERNIAFANVDTKPKTKGNPLLSWLPGRRG
jgi:hypothetical protein